VKSAHTKTLNLNPFRISTYIKMADDKGGRIFLVRPRAHDDGLSESQLSESVNCRNPPFKLPTKVSANQQINSGISRGNLNKGTESVRARGLRT
jgi:hypothetical protein